MSWFFPAPEVPMSRVQTELLQRLRQEERSQQERVSRAFGLPAALVARSKVLLAVADGHAYVEAAHLAGRRRATPSRRWSVCSIIRGWRRSSHATLVGQPSCTTRPPRSSASC